MKTRYLTLLFLTAAGASFGLGACDTGSSTLDPNVDARLRNNLPAACTADQIRACPAIDVTRCPAGQEPVIDYSSDCCAHFTCQPLCSAAGSAHLSDDARAALSAADQALDRYRDRDCCPAYRCEPDGMMCNPATGEKCGCDATNAACILALPYCGPDIQPIVVGQTADCCPVYQCPCARPVDPVAGEHAAPGHGRALLRLHLPRAARRATRLSAKAKTPAAAPAPASPRAASARTTRTVPPTRSATSGLPAAADDHGGIRRA